MTLATTVMLLVTDVNDTTSGDGREGRHPRKEVLDSCHHELVDSIRFLISSGSQKDVGQEGPKRI